MKYLFYYSIIVTALCVFSMKSCTGYKADSERLSNNQIALTEKIESYVTKDGKNAAKIIQLELKIGEFEKMKAEDAEKIKELGIKLKRLESISMTSTETESGGKVPIRDSVIYTIRDSVRYIDSIRYFKWNDTWSTISGVITPDSVECMYRGVDTMNIICHKVPRKILGFIPWGTKYIEVDVMNANPNTKVIYTESVKFTKGKR